MAKTAGLDAVNLNDRSMNIFQSETSALVPYLMGFNAKNQMRRDAYLMSFIPKITDAQMSKYGAKSLGDLEPAIYNDTRLLSKIVDESIESYRDEWENQKQLAEKIKQAASAAIRILEARQTVRKNGRISPDEVENLQEELDSSVMDINRVSDSLKELKAQEQAETLAEAKIKLRAQIMELTLELSRCTDSLSSTKATLIANKIFSFKDLNGAPNPNTTYPSYINNFVKVNMGKIKEIEEYYKKEYGCIPKFVQAFKHIIEFTGSMAFRSDVDLLGIKLEYEKDISQYISLLNDGPVMIQQVARMFPKLVRNFDSEKALYAAGKGNFLHGGIEYKDVDDMYRGRNKFFFSFLNMFAHDTITPLNRAEDRLILSIFGPPGIGKTASVESVSREMGYLFKSISIPHADSSVFAGLPAINEKDQVSQIVSSDMFDLINAPGILDLEEATAASDEAVKSQQARFLQNGEIGLTRQIHPLSVILMTANDDIHHNRNIELFSTVIMNRIRSVYWKNPDMIMNGWVNWIMNNPSIQSDQYDKKAHDLILSFLMQTSDGAKFWMPQGNNETSLATPSPRAWHNLAQDIGIKISETNVSQQEIADDIERSATAILGPEAARALSKHYLIVSNIPSIHAMIDRMKGLPGEKPFSIADAVRIFDMNNSELFDTSKTRTQEDAPANKKGKAGKNMKHAYKYAIEPNDKADDEFIKKYNEMKRIQTLPANHTSESLFMPIDELRERYNRIWGDENTDLNNTAVLFYFTSEIIFELDRLFDDAWKAQKPVDGAKLDDLMKLAMTLPAKDPRQALIIKMMSHKIMTPDKLETLSKFGLYYKNRDGEERIIKCVLPDIMYRDGTQKKFNIAEERAKNKDPNTVLLETPRLSAAQNVIWFCSKSYKGYNDPVKSKSNEDIKDKSCQTEQGDDGR